MKEITRNVIVRALYGGALITMVALASLRPLIAESYDSAGIGITHALSGIGDPSPVRTLVFDGLILFCGCVWLFAKFLDDTAIGRTGLGPGLVLILIGAVVSTIAAGNKRLAMNGSVDSICVVLLGVLLSQLMTKPWHRRLLLGAVLASAWVQAVECIDYFHFRFDDTWQYYLSQKADIWAKQGVALDSPQVELFERRILAKEASGFIYHSNVAGSYLVLCALGSLGMAVESFRRHRFGRDGWRTLPPLLGTALLVWAAVLTGSRGALYSGIAGICLWAIVARAHLFIERRPRTTLAISVLTGVVGIASVIVYGAVRGSLPGTSLNFRWQYWTASARMIVDQNQGLWGVGRENFGREYLRYKSIESPEEISTPHNLFVQAACEWGLLGLAGIVALVVAVLWNLTRQGARAPEGTELQGGDQSNAKVASIGVIVGVVVALTRIPLLDTENEAMLYWSTTVFVVAWMLGYFAYTASGAVGQARNGATGLAVSAGLFSFVLHDMINFAAFVPASASTFWALIGYVIRPRDVKGCRPGQPQRQMDNFQKASGGQIPHRAVFPIAVVLVVAAAGGFSLLILRPVVLCRSFLRNASVVSPQEVSTTPVEHVADRAFRAAAMADTLDPTPFVKRADWLLTIATRTNLFDSATKLAIESLLSAAKRDPRNHKLARLTAQVHWSRAEVLGSSADYEAAIASAKRALELYPQNPSGLVLLAHCQLAGGRFAGSKHLLEQAIENFQMALDMDDRRANWEVIRRFREREIAEIKAKIDEARDLAATVP